MAFIAGFIAHAPDGDASKVKALVETPSYKLHVVVAKDQVQAEAAAKALVNENGVQSIILCPGFTNKDVAKIQEVVGDGVAVCVARGDGPSSRISAEILAREWGIH